MRLTSVAHKAYDPLVLLRAYFSVERGAAAGVDGETWESWSDSFRDEVRALSDELGSGRYFPRPLRHVWIEKSDGGKRLLSIPSFRDRVAQLAFSWLVRWCYREEFRRDAVDLVYGPRARGAVARSAPWIRRSRYVLRTDITDCFGSIKKKRLLDVLRRKIADRRVLRWVDLWCDEETGLAQGNPSSPVLACVYLQRAFDGWSDQPGVVGCDRYIDDIAAGFYSARRAERFLAAMTERLDTYGLRLSEHKTVVARTREGVTFLGLKKSSLETLASIKDSSVQGSEASRLGVLRHYRSCGVARARLRGLRR